MTRATLGLIYYCLFYVAEVWYLLGDETKFRRREYLNIIREVFLKKGKEGMKDEILKLLIICFSFLLYREILLKRKKRIDSRSIYGNLRVALFRCHIASLEFSKEFPFNVVYIISS